jgi:hypothetical protein
MKSKSSLIQRHGKTDNIIDLLVRKFKEEELRSSMGSRVENEESNGYMSYTRVMMFRAKRPHVIGRETRNVDRSELGTFIRKKLKIMKHV